MGWARVGVAVGLLLLLAGFAVGVEPRVTSAGGQEIRCSSVLHSAWTPAPVDPAGCAAGGTGVRRATWGLLGVGLVTALLGWTAARERVPRSRALRPRARGIGGAGSEIVRCD